MKNSLTNIMFYLIIIALAMAMGQCKSPEEQKVTDSKKHVESLVAHDSSKGVATPLEVKLIRPLSNKKTKHQPLKLFIDNLASSSAPVVVIVFNSKDKFLKKNGKYKRYKFIPKSKILDVQIDDLEYGKFAIAIFQDMNANGKMDKNFVGIPTEGYAFSNNYKPKVKAPDYHHCVFSYHSKTPLLKMNLIK